MLDASIFSRELPGARWVEVRTADSLLTIALRELGDAKRWTELAALNNLRHPYIADAAAAFNYGVGKYGAWNWEKGIAARRIYAAACRHYHAIERGEPADPESGLDHHCHLAACAVMVFGATPEPCPVAEP